VGGETPPFFWPYATVLVPSRWADPPTGEEPPGVLGRLAAKQAIEVVLADAATGPTVLEQEPRQGGGDQAVLVPVGPGLDKGPHAIEQGLGDFRLEADVLGRAGRQGQGIGGWQRSAVVLAQARLLARDGEGLGLAKAAVEMANRLPGAEGPCISPGATASALRACCQWFTPAMGLASHRRQAPVKRP